MPDPSSDRNPVEALAEEFAARFRRGERPPLSDYVAQYPQWADEIRELFPALVLMEQFKPAAEDRTGDYAASTETGRLPLERLGDYRILREVGRGGMGIVYEAEQESLGRHVALKVLPSHALLDPKHLARFHREAKAAARLHHTNIVPVYGVGEADGLHYYVMQFIPGLGLDQVLSELKRLRRVHWPQPVPAGGGTGELSAAALAAALVSGNSQAGAAPSPPESPAPPRADPPRPAVSDTAVQLPGQSSAGTLPDSGQAYWQSVARIGIQVTEALAYAHDQGTLHRDIKPSNLLLDAQGVVWITDFGLAKAAADTENLTHPGDIVGTVRYMAPERFRGESDVRGDIYGLGLTLYELLTLRPAFAEADRGRLIEQVMHHSPPRPRKLNPAVPRDLETIVLKAIAREPGQRYPSAAELAEDLRRFVADRPIRARRTPVHERTWRWCRRNPALAAALFGVFACLAVIACVSTWSAVGLARRQQVAEDAEQDARQKLWESQLAQARALRWSGQPGRRFESLKALGEAAQLRFAPELRNEAVACLALADLRVVKQWKGRPHEPEAFGFAFDGGIERYARSEPKGVISVRRTADDGEVLLLTGPEIEGLAMEMQFSPDDRFLAAAFPGRGAQVWDVRSGHTVLYVPAAGGSGDVALPEFTPDSRQAIFAPGDGTIRFHELPAGKEIKRLTVSGGRMVTLRCHPKEKQIAVVGWNSPVIRIIDFDTGKVRRELPHPDQVAALSWHPDGRFLAVGCGHWFFLWDMATGKRRVLLEGHKSGIRGCAFSHGGDLLATHGWDLLTRLWDPISGRLLVTIAGNFSRFSRDDRWLGYAKGAEGSGEMGYWEVAAGRECRTFYAYGARGGGPWTVDISPRGQLLASGHDDGVRLWDLDSGKELAHLPVGSSRDAVFDPAGAALITTGRLGVFRWPIASDSQDGIVRVGPPLPLTKPPAGQHTRACLSLDGRWLAAITSPEEALVIDVQDPTRTVRLGSHRGLSVLAISPDGRWVATGTQHADGIKVWDARTGRLVKDVPAGGYAGVSFSPDGKWLVTSSWGKHFQTWAVGSWEEVPHAREHGGGVFSRDRTLLAFGNTTYSDSQQVVELVDAATGRDLARLHAPNPVPLGGVCFSPDARHLAVACFTSNLIQVWDLPALRRQLRDVNLDWDLAPYPPVPDGAGASPPLRVDVLLGSLKQAEQVREEQAKAAIARYQAFLKANPGHAEVCNNLAWTYVTAPPALRDAKAAVSLAEEAVRRFPQNPLYRNTLGVAYYRAGQYQQAVETLLANLRDTEDRFLPYDLYPLAMSYYRLGDAARAEEYFRWAKRWRLAQQDLAVEHAEELDAFRAEAEELLGKK